MNLTNVVLGCMLALALVSAPAPAAESKPLTNADIIKMVKAELPDSTILLALQNAPADFVLTPDALIELKSAGVSGRLVEAMLTKSAAAPTPVEAKAVTPPAAAQDLPTAYGFYIVVEGKVLRFTPTPVQRVFGLLVGGNSDRGFAVDGLPDAPPPKLKSQDFSFILYQKNIDPMGLRLALLMRQGDMSVRQFNIINTGAEFFQGVYGVSPYKIIPVNLWRPTAQIPVMVEPVEGRPDMYRLTPRGGFSYGNRYAFYEPEALHEADIVFSASPGAPTGSAYYFEFEAGPKLTAAQATALPLPARFSVAEFPLTVSAPVTAPAEPMQRYQSKAGVLVCEYPAGFSYSAANQDENETNAQSVVRFQTPNTTKGGLDGDRIFVRYTKKGFANRNITSEQMVQRGIEDISKGMQQTKVSGPVPAKLAGEDGVCLLMAGWEQGRPVVFVTTIVVTKKGMHEVQLFARAENLPSLWDDYRRVVASYSVTAK